MKKILFFLAFIFIFSACNSDRKNWIKNFEWENFSESSKIFWEISKKNLDEKNFFNLWNSLYKEKKFLEAEKIFKKISEDEKISELEKSWKVEYQIWNTKYKIWEKKEILEEKIEDFKESIANYELWIEKNNYFFWEEKNSEYENFDKILNENLEFVKKQLEQAQKEKNQEDQKKWKKPSSWNKKSEEKNQKKPEKNQLNQDDLQRLQNQLEKLNQEEIDLKWGFDRFWKNEFKLENEPDKMDMQTLEEFLKKEKDVKEEIFDSWMKDW